MRHVHFCIFVVFFNSGFLPQNYICSEEQQGQVAAEGGAGAVGLPAEPPLPPGCVKAHETIWKKEPVHVDPNSGKGYTSSTRLNWGRIGELGGEKKEIDYFMLFFPLVFFKNVVKWTSKNLEEMRKPTIDFGTLLKWIGLRLLIALDPIKGGLHDY